MARRQFLFKTNGSCTALLGFHGYCTRAACIFFLKTVDMVSFPLKTNDSCTSPTMVMEVLVYSHVAQA